MQPLHLAIGLVEGLVTASILLFLRKARPELLDAAATGARLTGGAPFRRILALFASAAFLLAFVFVGLASADPDGLEYAVAALLGPGASSGPVVSSLHAFLADLQQRLALFPDYAPRPVQPGSPLDPASPLAPYAALVGAGLALVLLAIVAALLLVRRRRNRRITPSAPSTPSPSTSAPPPSTSESSTPGGPS
jgi:cobalt/nickel transport system permease protein